MQCALIRNLEVGDKMSKYLLERIIGMSLHEKRRLVMEIEELACDNERRRKGCCRNVLTALQTNLGLGDGDLFRAAVPLGGGIARSGGTCGALLGGLMAIGLAYCKDKQDLSERIPSPSYEEAMAQSIKLLDRFKDSFGSLDCRDIQKSTFGKYYDLKIPHEAKKLAEFNRKAGYPVIAMGARVAAELILGISKMHH